VSAERARAAAVRASEGAALRRVHERQRLERTRREEAAKNTRSPRELTRDLRRAQRAVDEAEQQIGALERQITSISAALEDPQLYTRATGLGEARTLGRELEAAKRELDASLERWTAATDEVEALNRELASSGS
jgi:chromosome segregation ATPase